MNINHLETDNLGLLEDYLSMHALRYDAQHPCDDELGILITMG